MFSTPLLTIRIAPVTSACLNMLKTPRKWQRRSVYVTLSVNNYTLNFLLHSDNGLGVTIIACNWCDIKVGKGRLGLKFRNLIAWMLANAILFNFNLRGKINTMRLQTNSHQLYPTINRKYFRDIARCTSIARSRCVFCGRDFFCHHI